MLWQFPSTTKFDEANFAAFVEHLPQKIGERTIRHVLEVRHASFADPAFAALLRPHNIAIALVDAEDQPPVHADTADFVYARLKQADEAVETGYPPEALASWAKRFRSFAESSGSKRDCFVYFINGGKVRAPAAAMAFIELLR